MTGVTVVISPRGAKGEASSTGGAPPKRTAERDICCGHRRFVLAAAVPVVIVIAVVLPLVLEVVKLQGELAAATRPATSLAQGASAKGGSALDGEVTCRDVLPKVPAPLGSPPPALKLQGSKLVNAAKGTNVTLNAVNWFGFNNGKTMVDGLDAGNSTWLAADFATIAYRIKLLGFNAVRLPLKWTDLDLPTQDYTRICYPPEGLSGPNIARATLPSGLDANTPALRARLRPGSEFLVPINSAAGQCNSYLPSGPTTLPRLLWVVQYLVASGMYVILDYHPHSAEPQFLESPEIFARKWLGLWSALNCLPTYSSDLKGRLLLDLLNEPDEYKLAWSGGSGSSSSSSSSSSTGRAPLGSYLLAAMDAIEAVSPGEALFMIQGAGQQALGTAWGDGFATDAALLAQHRALESADPNAFFRALLAKPYRKQVILSPHFYGMTVTNSTATNDGLWAAMTQSWGRLTSDGFCASAHDCQRFPALVGEMGSFLRSPMDLQQFADAATYFNDASPTDQTRYSHEPVAGWAWFCWNANSKDTGGLVQDDWETLQMHKINWMVDHLGLAPWWLQPPAAHKPEAAGEELVGVGVPEAKPADLAAPAAFFSR